MPLHNLHEMRDRGGGPQEVQHARKQQAAAAALPPGAPRPVPGFADVAAELAPRRMVASVVSAARAAGIPVPEHLASPEWLPGSAQQQH